MPFLNDHRIGGNCVLPTVCALAWMKQAAQLCFAPWQCHRIEDYRLFKGIVFDGSEPAQCEISLQLVAHDENTVQLEAKVASVNAQGKPQFHYAAKLTLTRQVPLAPVYQGKVNSAPAQSAAPFYTDGTLFHGESLQGIKAWQVCDEHGLQLQCVISAASQTKAGAFPLAQSNIFAQDLVYQAMLVWLKKQYGVGSLPSATGAWQNYREVRADETFTLVLQSKTYHRQQFTADIFLVDSQNQLIAQITDAQVVANENLSELFQQRVAQ